MMQTPIWVHFLYKGTLRVLLVLIHELIPTESDYHSDKKKANKLKANEVSIDADDLEVKRRGKNKKTSRDRRRKKRQRFYSSESDSSSDSET
ncbi:peptidyl-prolyl cis-trans isomerase CYP95-like [Papaver somniferum]|uniref:peptidyl-prolyl cis-trans isomerase CYP95-like n=1 Tax=Papaver somniferum TaxID=3469 RepID=UPI000E6FA38D|nr:peptidyl-prolyl cis-trans isomerase CYP95-like [Papaver somniferum]